MARRKASARRSGATRRSRICSGRLMSYAGLVYSGDTTDPVRAKFYGDTQERLTAASSELLFFGLELNRIDDAVHGRGHGRRSRWPITGPGSRICARTSPIQLEDKIEKLFHEKSVTGRSAWNRLFDETIASLRFTVRGEELPIEPTLNKLQDPDESVRKDASDALAKTFKAEPAHLHAHHQHARQGQGNLRPLARLRGRGGFAPSRQPGRARGGGGAGLGRARSLSAPVAPLLRPEGEVVRQGQARSLGPQRAPAEGRAAHDRLGRGAGTRSCPPIRPSRRAWPTSPGASSTRAGSMRRPGPARRPAPSLIRPCRPRTLTCC